MNKEIFIGIDPGKSGAVSVIIPEKSYAEVFDVPLKHDVKKKKTVYDTKAMADIIRPYAGQKTLVCIESVHSMPGEGSSSSFSFGRGLGLWEGIVAALECDCEMVTPQTWKKQWANDLIVKPEPKPDILTLTSQEIKKLGKNKVLEQKEANKEYNKRKAKHKESAKDAARALASTIYPKLSDKFLLKKHDGRAESMLIAERARIMSKEDKDSLNGK